MNKNRVGKIMFETLPFMTILTDKKNDKTFLCVINSVSKNYISYYYLDELSSEDFINFAKLSNQWWQSNPILPISLYHKNKFNQYNYAKHWLLNNEYKIISGFEGIDLKKLVKKRIKRKIWINSDTNVA